MNTKLISNFICIISLVISIFSAVNESTGHLSLDIPLVTVQGARLSLPINLSYTSGIKIDDKSSWVGLGFDLGIPYIEREVAGAPDEFSGVEQCQQGDVNGLFNVSSRKWYDALMDASSNSYKTTGLLAGDFTNLQDHYSISSPVIGGYKNRYFYV